MKIKKKKKKNQCFKITQDHIEARGKFDAFFL
jgi:hypothetical protein